MTSQDLKLKEKAPKDVYGPDKTLPKVEKYTAVSHNMNNVINDEHTN